MGNYKYLVVFGLMALAQFFPDRWRPWVILGWMMVVLVLVYYSYHPFF